MPHDVNVAISIVKRWLTNAVSRGFLKFLSKNDRCGNRLSLAIDCYLDKKVDVCAGCKFAGAIFGLVVERGKGLFNVNEGEIKKCLANPVFKRSLISVLSGIAKYGVTMPQIINAPFLVVWDFTRNCNLRCRHCYQDSKETLSDELTTRDGKKLIDELVDAGVSVLAFSGGEPLIRKDFFELADYAGKKEMFIAIATNGTLISEDVAQKLKELGTKYVEISLDGKDAETHDEFRGIPGAFDRTIKGIENCVKCGLCTAIAVTVTSKNYEQIPEMYELACKLGVKKFICFNFIPTRRGEDIINEDINPEQREKLLHFLAEKNLDGKIEALSTAPQIARVSLVKRMGIHLGHYFRKEEGYQDRTIAEFIGGCGAGRAYCGVEPNGDVYPCVFIPVKLGNIREQSFSEIWHNAPVLKQLRDRSLLKGHCSKCEYKFLCGGCRARAWAYFKDLSAPDPGCIYNKEHWENLKIK